MARQNREFCVARTLLSSGIQKHRFAGPSAPSWDHGRPYKYQLECHLFPPTSLPGTSPLYAAVTLSHVLIPPPPRHHQWDPEHAAARPVQLETLLASSCRARARARIQQHANRLRVTRCRLSHRSRCPGRCRSPRAPAIGTVLNLRTTTSQKCEAVPRRARI